MKTHVRKLLTLVAFLATITPLSMPVLAETFSPCGKVFTSTFPTGWATDSNQTLTFTFDITCKEFRISAEKPHRPLVSGLGKGFDFASPGLSYAVSDSENGINSFTITGRRNETTNNHGKTTYDQTKVKVTHRRHMVDVELLLSARVTQGYERFTHWSWFAGTGFDEKRR